MLNILNKNKNTYLKRPTATEVDYFDRAVSAYEKIFWFNITMNDVLQKYAE
jgi:hypothetical protein